MTIEKIDHVVLTAADPEASLAFYRALGFRIRQEGQRWALFSGSFKLNLHALGRELPPHARAVQPGSADLCLEIRGGLAQALEEVRRAGLTPETGLLARTGARGPMHSFYLRDPDGNLIELCSYSA